MKKLARLLIVIRSFEQESCPRNRILCISFALVLTPYFLVSGEVSLGFFFLYVFYLKIPQFFDVSEPDYCTRCGNELDRFQGRCCGITHRFGVQDFLRDPQSEIEEVRRWRAAIVGELKSMASNRESWRNNSVSVSDIRLFNSFSHDGNFATEINLCGASMARRERNTGSDVRGRLDQALRSQDLPDELSMKISGVKNHARTAEESYDDYFKSRGACYKVGSDMIVLEHISSGLVNDLGLDMKKVPPILKPMMDYLIRDYSSNFFRALIDHELTHAWLKKNTRIGKEQARALSGDITTFDSEGQPSSSQQVLQVTRNSDLRTIDESFAYFLNVKVGNSVPTVQSLKDTGYQDSTLIKWGSKIAHQKYQRMNGRGKIEGGNDVAVDWARELEAEIYHEILMKGQVDRRPMISFLKHCIYSSDKEKMKNIKKIVEKELKLALKDVKSILNRIEDYEQSQKHRGLVSDVRTVEEDFNWGEPDQFEEKILNDILEAAAKSIKERDNLKTLDWVSRALKQIIADELSNLKQYESELKKLVDELPNRDEKTELSNAINEIRQVRQDINRKAYS